MVTSLAGLSMQRADLGGISTGREKPIVSPAQALVNDPERKRFVAKLRHALSTILDATPLRTGYLNPTDLVKFTPLMAITGGSPEVKVGIIDGPVFKKHFPFRGKSSRNRFEKPKLMLAGRQCRLPTL